MDVFVDLGFHNMYLDVFAFLGLIGLMMFIATIVWLMRQEDVLVRAMVVLIAVWFNTAGAYPNLGMGLLAMCLAVALGNRVEGDLLPVWETRRLRAARRSAPEPMEGSQPDVRWVGHHPGSDAGVALEGEHRRWSS
jgi:hypothetical protein